ncbi:MAG: hypothetical protein PHR68_04715 [Candidatus Gracilibacteria bacterium]|nr:hypothetical protein [Candidatus Gracilibacteria bacterium]
MKKSIKKVDKLVTGLIIGGAVASIFGIAANTKKGKEVTKEVKESSNKIAKKGFALFGKTLVKVLDLFDKSKK